MSIDAKKIAERITSAENKKRFTYSLTPSVVKDFNIACDKLGINYGPALEELMKEFIDSSKKKGK